MLAAALHLVLALAPLAEPAAAVAPAAPPVETAAAPEAAAPVAAVAPLAPSAAVQPAAAPEAPRPRFRGIGMFVAGGLLGVGAFPFKIIATSSDMRTAGEIDRGLTDPSVCIEGCYVGFWLNMISMPFLTTSAGLIGGGMTMHGRWAAHRDASRGQLHSVRRSRLMIGLGLGAIGAGLGAFMASRFALRNADSDGQYVARRELGWWGALTGVYAGAGLTGHGVGYEAGRRNAQRRVQARLAPMLSPQVVGLGVSGRF